MTEFWSSVTDNAEPLTLEKMQAMVDHLNSGEFREAERRATVERVAAYTALRQAAERAGVLEDPAIMVALMYVHAGMPVSPSLYDRVRALLTDVAQNGSDDA